MQGSVRLNDRSEPQPDLALLRRRPDASADAAAGPDDILLIVEVADTSLAYDRREKVPLYARTAVPEVWVVDLNGEHVIVYREPSQEGYRSVAEVRGEASVSPQAFPELHLTVAQILAGLH